MFFVKSLIRKGQVWNETKNKIKKVGGCLDHRPFLLRYRVSGKLLIYTADKFVF